MAAAPAAAYGFQRSGGLTKKTKCYMSFTSASAPRVAAVLLSVKSVLGPNRTVPKEVAREILDKAGLLCEWRDDPNSPDDEDSFDW